PETFIEVQSLPAPWRDWAFGWKYCKAGVMEEPVGERRDSEPVEISLAFLASQAESLAREIRIARVDSSQLIEVPSQVFRERRRGDLRSCSVLWMPDSLPRQLQTFLIFYGNPDA